MRLSRAVVAAAAILVLLAGCGGSGSSDGIASLDGGDGGTTTTAATGTTVDREQAMLDFAQCMRDQGIDIADPVPDEDGHYSLRGLLGGAGAGADPADREAMRTAREACSEYLEGVAQQFDRPDMTEMQDLMIEYAACMREHGVDMPDPDFSDTDGGQGPGARLGFGSGDFDRDDPAFQAANEACREIFGATGMPGLPGGGPGGMGPGGGAPPGEPPPEGTPPDSDD